MHMCTVYICFFKFLCQINLAQNECRANIFTFPVASHDSNHLVVLTQLGHIKLNSCCDG